jgi:hypothetical protein
MPNSDGEGDWQQSYDDVHHTKTTPSSNSETAVSEDAAVPADPAVSYVAAGADAEAVKAKTGKLPHHHLFRPSANPV